MPIERRETPPTSTAARLFASLAVLALAGTWVAAQVDFIRRHTLGSPPIHPMRYWLPQLTQIWLPGLGAALVCAALAFALHRRGRVE
jgi:hypothetical protein